MKNLSFNLEDLIQIAIGAFALSIPISFSEEAWIISESLPAINLLFVIGISLIFITLYAFQSVFGGNVNKRVNIFLLRICIAYITTLAVVALVLFSLDKLPLLTDPIVAIKRVLVIAMPASMGAIIVDGFDKE